MIRRSMTRTGVLSLLIAAYAVTNTPQVYSQSSASYPQSELRGRNLQSVVPAGVKPGASGSLTPSASAPTVTLSRLEAVQEQIFAQFMDSKNPRLEGHLTTDKLYYRAKDAVFVDLVVNDAFNKQPYTYTQGSVPETISVKLYDSANQVSATITQSLLNPALGVSFKLPANIQAGSYTIIASSDNMAPAVRTIQVLDNPATPQQPSLNAFEPYLVFFMPSSATQDPDTGVYTNVPVAGRFTLIDGQTYSAISSKPQVKVEVIQTVPQQDGSLLDTVIDQLGSQNAINYLDQSGTINFFFNNYIGAFNNDQQPRVVVTVTINGQTLTYTQPITHTTELPTPYSSQSVVTQQLSARAFDRVQCQFVTESLSDLVDGIVNKIYFQTFITPDGVVSDKVMQQDYLSFGAGSLNAYDPKLLNPTVRYLAPIYSQLNGYGSFSFPYNAQLAYFIEFKINEWTPSKPSSSALPLDTIVIRPDGTVRCPLIVRGIQTRAKEIEKRQYMKKNPGTFIVENLAGFKMDVDAEISGVTYRFKYDRGFYTVSRDDLPPIFVFNRFPSATNFMSALHFLQASESGLISVSEQEAIKVEDSIQMSAETVSKTFVAKIANLIQTQYNPENKNTIEQIGLKSTTTYTLDNLKSDVAKLGALFDQIPGKPTIEPTYFGKYGPLNDQKPDTITQNQDAALSTSKVLVPSVRLGLSRRVVNNTEALVVSIYTNTKVNPEHTYILQIKQKENIIFQTQMSFKAVINETKVTIPASSFPFTMGGVLQVNLYRVTDDFITFQTTTTTTQLCNTQVIETAYNGLSTQDKAALATLNAIDTDQMTIADAITKSNLVSTFSKCVLIHPDLAIRFLDIVGTISFFKKPAATFSLSIATNKKIYLQGEEVTADITLIDPLTKKPVTTGVHSASIFVSEDRDIGLNAFTQASLPGKVYLEGEIDFNRVPQLEPLSQVDQHFGSTRYQNNDNNLEILLGITQLRTFVYESATYGLYSNQNKYVPDDLTNALPRTLNSLSRQFGYNFNPRNIVKPFTFAVSNIASFIDLSQSAYFGDQLTPRPSTYFRAPAPIDSYASVQQAVLSEWKLTLPGNYLRSNNLYQAETLYYANNVRFTNGKATIKFFTGDLPGKFRIRANSYSIAGYGFGQQQIATGSAFGVTINWPQRMVVGDKINVTAIISNANNAEMTVTPELTGGSQFVEADFKYFVRVQNQVTKLYSLQERNTYTIPSNTTDFQVVFTISALQFASYEPITFKFSGVLGDGNSFAQTLTTEMMIADAGLEVWTTQSGQIGTRVSGSAIPSIAEVTFKVPTADLLESVYGEVLIHPSHFSYLYSVVKRTVSLGAGSDFYAEDAVFKLKSITQFLEYAQSLVGPLSLDPARAAQVQQILSMITDVAHSLQEFVNALDAFQVKDGTVFKGYDYFRSTTQKEGSMILTATILRALKDAAEAGAEVANDNNSQFQRNLVWLTGRITSDSFKLKDTDVDASSAIPQDYVDLYIVSQIYGIQKLGQSTNTELDAVLSVINTAYYVADGNGATYLTKTETPLSSDPYFLALSAYTFDKSVQDYDNSITAIITRLKAHITIDGKVTIPALAQNNVYSPFQSVKIARDNELLALTALVLQGDSLFGVLSNQLKTRGARQGFGSKFATFLAFEVMSQDSSRPFYNLARCEIALSYNGVQVSTMNYLGEFTPMRFRIDPSLLSAGDASNTRRFTIAVQKDTAYDNNQDIVFGYQAFITNVDNSFSGQTTSVADLSLTVLNLNATGQLGRAKLGSTFIFNATVLNPNKNRNEGLTVLVVRPPSCLSFSATQLAKFTGPAGIIQYFEADEYSHEYYIYFRGISKGNSVKISLSFTQVSVGVCTNRRFMAYYENSFRQTLVSSLPKI